jgi:hypothetical protein
MESDLFDGLCRALGYQPDSVLSIRVNPREVVVVHADATGDLRRAIRRIGDERRHRPAPPPGMGGAIGPRCGGGAAVGEMTRTTGLGSSSRAGSTAVGCPGSAGGPAAGVSAATGEPVARGGMRGHRVLVTLERGRASVGRARR